jgi:hypothetical protein
MKNGKVEFEIEETVKTFIFIINNLIESPSRAYFGTTFAGGGGKLL